MKNRKSYISATIISLLWLGINYYIYFPALNVQSREFWSWLLVHSVIISCIFIFSGIIGRSHRKKMTEGVRENISYFRYGKGKLQLFFLVGIPVACILVLMIGNLSGATLFHAKKYSRLLTVEERDFTTDIQESENVDNIALMDTNSAKIFGNRKIGSLSDVVSQFEVEDNYTQINIANKPMKVANLRYAGFFKYMNNKSNGIPGYIKVNPVDFEAEYVKLDKGMKYVSSGYFNDNIYRYVQIHNPTKIIDDCYFEVNDDGKPFYVCPVMHARVGLFGGMDVKGAILCDPVTGKMEYYDVADIPTWIDRIYDGELLEQKFNWYGILSDGYFNSVIGQKGCIQTTDDYGYKTMDDDVWVYTGVTSVTGDASNVGFVMINQRTSEARYYSISGAEEYSAMSSAEGEVQEKSYHASFPSLVNVDGEPTYIMVLTDNGGLVKMYAMVNVEQYNLVVTAESQEEVFAKYRKLLSKNKRGGSDDIENSIKEAELIVADMEYITIGGETYVYIKDEAGNVYKQKFSDDETIIKVSVGDTIFLQYEENESGIHTIIIVEIKEKGSASIPKTQTGKTENSNTAADTEKSTEVKEEKTDNKQEITKERTTENNTEDAGTEDEVITTENEGNSI